MTDKPIKLVGGPMDGRTLEGAPKRVHLVKDDNPGWVQAEYRRRDIQRLEDEYEVWDYVEEPE